MNLFCNPSDLKNPKSSFATLWSFSSNPGSSLESWSPRLLIHFVFLPREKRPECGQPLSPAMLTSSLSHLHPSFLTEILFWRNGQDPVLGDHRTGFRWSSDKPPQPGIVIASSRLALRSKKYLVLSDLRNPLFYHLLNELEDQIWNRASSSTEMERQRRWPRRATHLGNLMVPPEPCLCPFSQA